MNRPPPHTPPRRRPFGRVKPSYLVLLAATPLIVTAYLRTPDYRDALLFLLPGLRYTLAVTVLAYALAIALGLVLAGLLLLRTGRRTVPTFTATAALLAAAGAALLAGPTDTQVLAGAPDGRVAIVRGTPDRIVDAVRDGTYAADAAPRRFLSARDVDAARAYLADGRVAAVLLPADALPPGLPERWRATYLPDAYRTPATLLLATAGLVALLAFAASQTREHPLAIFASLYVDLVRGIPMLVVILFVGFVLPGALRDLTGGRLQIRDDLLRGVLAVAIGYAAYLAEIFRAGLEAVPRGQVEAARTLGLSGRQTARFVVLPQAVRIVLPPLGNEFVAMLKDTALLSVIGVGDVTQKAREYGAATLNLFPPYNSAAALYVALTLTASSLLRGLERRTSAADR